MVKLYKGMRILFFKEIYERYSQLDFTYPTDRAVGIRGIETRLAKLFGNAQYGIIQDPREYSYLPRTLLWQRADREIPMEKIGYPESRTVPSWSWMAVSGAVHYVDIPFAAVDWNTNVEAHFDDFANPTSISACNQPLPTIRGIANNFVQEPQDDVIFDCALDASSFGNLGCLILGTDSELVEGRQRHYALIIVPTEHDDLYQRIGVGILTRDDGWMESMPGQDIRLV